MNLSFRNARGDDMAVLLDLIRQLYAHENIPYERARTEGAVNALLADGSLGEIYLMESGETAIGYFVLTFVFVLEFSGRCAFIDELFVAPAQRGQGIGGQALEWIEAACRQRNLRAIRLEVERGNPSAQKLYAKAGFALHDRGIMTKQLGL